MYPYIKTDIPGGAYVRIDVSKARDVDVMPPPKRKRPKPGAMREMSGSREPSVGLLGDGRDRSLSRMPDDVPAAPIPPQAAATIPIPRQPSIPRRKICWKS